MVNRDSLREALSAIRASLNEADNAFFQWGFTHDEQYGDECQKIVEAYIESAFTHMLVLLDSLDLARTYDQISKLFAEAKKEGLTKSNMGLDEPYLVWGNVLSDYLGAIGESRGVHSDRSIRKDLVSILRATIYPITDQQLFSGPPRNESEVHNRIEGILRCVFPDLKHKPQLTKPIKNFEPDTGLPAIRTLIEYKFVKNTKDAKSVSEEILADTRGYLSKDWDTFMYVIYETHRIKPESEWHQLMTECGVGPDTQILVISGVPPKQRRKGKAIKKTKNS